MPIARGDRYILGSNRNGAIYNALSIGFADYKYASYRHAAPPIVAIGTSRDNAPDSEFLDGSHGGEVVFMRSVLAAARRSGSPLREFVDENYLATQIDLWHGRAQIADEPIHRGSFARIEVRALAPIAGLTDGAPPAAAAKGLHGPRHPAAVAANGFLLRPIPKHRSARSLLTIFIRTMLAIGVARIAHNVLPRRRRWRGDFA